MKEAYIAYIWQYRLYQHQQLKTTKGENIKVLHPGTLNKDAGPDFFNAKIQIGSTLWAGNVEPVSKLFSKDNMIYYQLTSYKRRRRDYPIRLAKPEYAHLQKLIFTSPKETQNWLDETFPSP